MVTYIRTPGHHPVIISCTERNGKKIEEVSLLRYMKDNETDDEFEQRVAAQYDTFKRAYGEESILIFRSE